MSLDVIPADIPAATDTPEPGTRPVFRKVCCGVPREQACEHDFQPSAFEPDRMSGRRLSRRKVRGAAARLTNLRYRVRVIRLQVGGQPRRWFVATERHRRSLPIIMCRPTNQWGTSQVTA